MAVKNSSNLCEQLIQRERNMGCLGDARNFTAHLYRERYRFAKNLYKTDLKSHYGCVNAIEFSHGGKYLASGGDDKRVLIWDVEMAIANRGHPRSLDTEHSSNIFCLGFDINNRKVFSGGNDDLVLVHDFQTGKLSNVFKHDSPVYGLSVDPQSEHIFATACEDGKILVFDQRIHVEEPLIMAQLRTSFHAVEFHPGSGHYMATANSKRGAAFWDIRKPQLPVIQYGFMDDLPSCMSVRFNSNGTLILALRRRLPPILYNTQSSDPVCTFYHDKYYNSCTMKSCTFAGEDDEFVLSGSDDSNLYVWRVSDVDLERTGQWIEKTQMILYGHRSIVNQVRYNRQKCLLASSGVEKVVKLWSPFEQSGWTGSLLKTSTCPENPREPYTLQNFPSMTTQPHSWSQMSHDYSTRNTSEDPRMMAFFDSLIQQDILGWDTNSSTDSTIGSQGSNNTQTSSTENNDDEEDEENDDDDDDSDDDDNDDDGDDNNNRQRNGAHIVTFTWNRQTKGFLIRKKDIPRHRNTAHKKIHRQKYTNRIAFLIATKRNELRRLAIKGASANNRRSRKVVKVVGKYKCNNSRTNESTSGIKRRCKTRQVSLNKRKNVVNNGMTASNATSSNVAVASTSADAASTTDNCRPHRRKYRKSYIYNSTSSDDNEDDEIDAAYRNGAASSSSSRHNGLSHNNNAAVPSTSTGITNSLKDDIMRLRRQQQHIIDSDEDEDEDEEEAVLPTGSGGMQTRGRIVDTLMGPKKKLNGARRTQDNTADRATNQQQHTNMGTHTTNSISTTEANTHDVSVIQNPIQHRQISLRSTISAAVNDAASESSTDETLTQPTTSPSSPSATTMLPQSGTNTINNNNTATNTTTYNLRSSYVVDLVHYHPNPRVSVNGYDDDALDSSTSSSTSDALAVNRFNNARNYRKTAEEEEEAEEAYDGQVTPVKRRRLAVDGYPNISPIGHNNNNNNTSNEHNNNGIYRPTFERLSVANNNSNNSSTISNALLVTPDSGISMMTPIASNYNQCHDGTDEEAGTANVEDDLAASTSKSSTKQSVKGRKAVTSAAFHQKMARVRRNYRKKFAPDESDSD